MQVTEIQQKIQNAKDLDFGTIFNESIELFKKVWVQGLVTLLLTMVMAIPIIMIVYIPLMLSGVMSSLDTYDAYGNYDQYARPEISPLLMIVMFVVYVFIIAVMATISFGLKAAFYRICKLKDLEQMGKEDYFFFFKKRYLKKTITLSLAFTGIAILATLLCFFPIFYVMVPLSFMLLIYAFNPDMSISDIIKLGFEIGNKKWFITFGLIIVCGFLAGIVGFLMCGVGIYVTSSFADLPQYIIYKNVIGFNTEDEQLIEENSIF